MGKSFCKWSTHRFHNQNGMKYINTKFELYGSYWQNSYPLLGHNRDYAYGLTMFENDIDLYQEEIIQGCQSV
jgi:acyl-homoserine lactone acylase PvdQ